MRRGPARRSGRYGVKRVSPGRVLQRAADGNEFRRACEKRWAPCLQRDIVVL